MFKKKLQFALFILLTSQYIMAFSPLVDFNTKDNMVDTIIAQYQTGDTIIAQNTIIENIGLNNKAIVLIMSLYEDGIVSTEDYYALIKKIAKENKDYEVIHMLNNYLISNKATHIKIMAANSLVLFNSRRALVMLDNYYKTLSNDEYQLKEYIGTILGYDFTS